MTDPASPDPTPGPPGPTPGSPETTPGDPTGSAAAPVYRAPDPERGLRGATSATLILQALTVLLSIPVARNTGSGTTAVGVIIIVVLALAMIMACAFVKKPWATAMIVTLQVLTIAGWFISGYLGVVGVIFGIAFAVIFWFRYEYRRRGAAGQLPGQPNGPRPPNPL